MKTDVYGIDRKTHRKAPNVPFGIPKKNSHKGATGLCGSNDIGRAIVKLRLAAKHLKEAESYLLYPSMTGGKKPLKDIHPIAISLKQLSIFDKQWCFMANEKHDPTLFKTEK